MVSITINLLNFNESFHFRSARFYAQSSSCTISVTLQ